MAPRAAEAVRRSAGRAVPPRRPAAPLPRLLHIFQMSPDAHQAATEPDGDAEEHAGQKLNRFKEH